LYCSFCYDVLECAPKQKTGKAVGLDGIAMEAIVNGGLKLAVHLSILFNPFLTDQYLPSSFMQSVIIPLVKSKSGDSADVNSHRATAISTSIVCLNVECVIASEVFSNSEYDKYQLIWL